MSDRFILPGQSRRQHSLLDRRQLLQAGVVGAAGLSLPRLLQTEETAPTAGNCILFFLEGGPMKRGLVYGTSDSIGAYPASMPVTPEDVTATIFRALGVPPETRIYDQSGRPHTLAPGTPIMDLFA